MAQRILICTNFLDGLARLVDHVHDLGAAGFKQVVFLHCIPLDAERDVPHADKVKVEAAHARLAPALASRSTQMEVEVVVEAGLPAERIQATVKRFASELIIIGTAQRTLLDEKLFGSTTAKLAQQVDIPLLIFRPQLIRVFTKEELALRAQHLLKSVLVPFDGSAASQHLVRFLSQWLAPLPQELVEQALLCWVTKEHSQGVVQMKPTPQADLKVLETVSAALEAAGLKVTQAIRQGESLAEVEAVAVEQGTSAIAIASNHFGRLLEWSVPSFAGELVRRSWHPILFIPMGKASS
jgi:nucleotide-binding universal stress UspA family protein